MVESRDPASVAAMVERVEALLASFETVATPRQAHERAEELVRTIVGLYGAGLERVLSIVHDAAGERSPEVFARLCQDSFVESLLCLHDLHPLSLDERVRAALDSVRPYLKSHEGGVEIVRVEGAVAYLRLEGSCDGCPSSTATVKLAVERAIRERVPEVREVRVEGVLAGGSSLRIESGWLALAGLPELASRGLATLEIEGAPVVLVRFDETVYAYRNRCAACAASFDGAIVERPLLACPRCGRAYDVVRAGRANDGGPLFIEPFPLSREGGRVRLAIPVGAA